MSDVTQQTNTPPVVAAKPPVLPPTNDASASKPEPVKVSSGRTIKYIGMSDIRRLEVGENLLETQEVGLQTEVEWKPPNHLVHTADFPDVPDAFWNQLVSYDTFVDVTDMTPEEIPQSDWQQIYRPAG